MSYFLHNRPENNSARYHIAQRIRFITPAMPDKTKYNTLRSDTILCGEEPHAKDYEKQKSGAVFTAPEVSLIRDVILNA